MKHTFPLAIALAVGALALSLWWSSASDSTDERSAQGAATPSKTTRPSPSQPAPSRADLSVMACQFEVGDTLAFTLDQQTSFLVNPTALIADPESRPKTLSGQRQRKSLRSPLWLWRVLDGDGAQWTLASIMADADVSVDDEPVAKAISEGLGIPIIFTMDRRCRINRVGMLKTMRPEPALEHQMSLMMAQIHVDPQATTWDARQTDTLGTYRVAYTRDGYEITREKDRYVRVKKPNPKVEMRAKVLDGTGTGRFDDSGRWFQQVNISDHVVVLGPSGTFANVQTTIDIARTETPSDHPFYSMKIDRGRYRLVSAHQVAQPQRRKRFEHPAIAGLAKRAFGSVKDEFGALIAAKDSKLKNDALRLLVQYLRLDPTHVAELMASLRDGSFPKHAEATAFLALELAGGSAAHAALRAAAEDPDLSRINRLRAVSALGDSRDATDGFVDDLIAIESRAAGKGDGEMSGSTAMALGTLGKNEALSDSAQKKVTDFLVDRLKAADDVGDTTTSLAALSNRMDGSTAEEIEPYLESEHPSVRGAAYGALARLERLPEPSELLDSLVEDRNMGVKKRIAESIGSQRSAMDDDDYDKAIRLVSNPEQDDAFIIGALIDVIGPVAKTNPAAREALRSIFRSSKTPEILRQIGRYLSAEDLQ